MLRVEGLNVSYGVLQVIHDVAFVVDEGECVALLGSNGAGKTTVLKALSGLAKATCRELTFLGKSVDGSSAALRYESGIVQVPEGRRVFPYMTAYENLVIGAAGRKEAWKQRHETLKWVFKLFPMLEKRSGLQVRLLSGGEQQMLVIGRGLMARPRLLMIDEPSLGLAPRILQEIYDIMRQLREEGVTILLSEQNAKQALALAGRAYVLENGRIVMSGSRDQLLASEHIRKAYLGL